MLNFKFIAVGGGANKAAIELLESGTIKEEQLVLLNSTTRDIPANYQRIAYQFSEDNRGCGKERTKAKKMILNALKTEQLDFLEAFIDKEKDDACVIITTSEGGSGSGSTSILAKYIKDVIGIKLHIFIFTGFEVDGRSAQNTIELLQELDNDYTIHTISNKKCLESDNNFIAAEKRANEEMVKKIKVLIGEGVVDAEQNIDDYDLYKVSNTSGYTDIGYTELVDIKNVDQFNKAVIDMLDNLKSLEVSEKSVKRLAVFLNIKDKTKNFIDFKFNVLKDRFGTAFEVYTHVQYEPNRPESLAFIASGMQMPIDEVRRIYESYKEASNSVNKAKDNFFKTLEGFEGNYEDAMFDFEADSIRETSSKDDFFGLFYGKKSTHEKQSNKKDIGEF